jgi:fatty-acyl-CoA synthase
LIPHRALIGNLTGFVCSQNWFGFDPFKVERPSKAVFWSPADWAWTGGLMDALLPSLYFGRPIVAFNGRFSPETAFEILQSHAVTHTFLVPTMLATLLAQDPGDFPQRLATLTTLGYGSAPIPAERLRELIKRYGPIFIQLYGMAEIASIGTLLRKQDHVAAITDKPHLLASCGQPSYATTVRLAAPGGGEVQTGETAEIVFGGPHTMLGYFREPERTDKALIGGWLHSGDVGRMDSEGYFYIVDRIKDLIIRGGYNLAPSEVEAVLYTHPAVLDAAVIGIPDDKWGEAVLAVVTLKPGTSASPDELLALCRQSKLASIKQPERVELVATMPRNTIGKIDKKALRDPYWEGRRKV